MSRLQQALWGGALGAAVGVAAGLLFDPPAVWAVALTLAGAAFGALLPVTSHRSRNPRVGRRDSPDGDDGTLIAVLATTGSTSDGHSASDSGGGDGGGGGD